MYMRPWQSMMCCSRRCRSLSQFVTIFLFVCERYKQAQFKDAVASSCLARCTSLSLLHDYTLRQLRQSKNGYDMSFHRGSSHFLPTLAPIYRCIFVSSLGATGSNACCQPLALFMGLHVHLLLTCQMPEQHMQRGMQSHAWF